MNKEPLTIKAFCMFDGKIYDIEEIDDTPARTLIKYNGEWHEADNWDIIGDKIIYDCYKI